MYRSRGDHGGSAAIRFASFCHGPRRTRSARLAQEEESSTFKCVVVFRWRNLTPGNAGCVETEVGSGNPEPIFVSGGCGPDVDGTEHVVGEDGESHPAFDPSPDRRRSSRLS